MSAEHRLDQRARLGKAFIDKMSQTDAEHNRKLWDALDSEAQYYVRRTLWRLPPGCRPIKPRNRPKEGKP